MVAASWQQRLPPHTTNNCVRKLPFPYLSYAFHFIDLTNASSLGLFYFIKYEEIERLFYLSGNYNCDFEIAQNSHIATLMG